jgi:tetraprenyl-beta-curcumene synthase
MGKEVFEIETNYDSGLKLVLKFIMNIFPEVDKQLKSWTFLGRTLDDAMLGEQALSSIKSKKFHAQGGSIYALYPNVDPKGAVKFIVSLQTISDYLDNLCDRAGIQDEPSFRQLHLSMLDAVDTGRKMSDYYKYYPYKSDNGYLNKLVEECRSQITKLPSYYLVQDIIKKYVHLYSDLQTYKHLAENIREEQLKTWASYYTRQYPGISCWEFSAAAGSTLGMFMLFAAASDPGLTITEVKNIDYAYFPWICSLHILLDYYIDAQEDFQMGDLNFTYYYKNLKHCEERLSYFLQKSIEHCAPLRHPEFHLTIVRGLLAMYLSDPKASWGLNKLASQNLLLHGGKEIKLYYNMCRLLRAVKIM